MICQNYAHLKYQNITYSIFIRQAQNRTVHNDAFQQNIYNARVKFDPISIVNSRSIQDLIFFLNLAINLASVQISLVSANTERYLLGFIDYWQILFSASNTKCHLNNLTINLFIQKFSQAKLFWLILEPLTCNLSHFSIPKFIAPCSPEKKYFLVTRCRIIFWSKPFPCVRKFYLKTLSKGNNVFYSSQSSPDTLKNQPNQT
ncbi:unnamed protein product [Paramecium octaurelia]|uniref:Uncharacterized protein n=1 Tax=Paramecium octaurelia TaxID=43137 RepID=A0A8S1YSU0_PAROT|nr:unnamed protein product [Paramecium octaurelia]